MLLLGRCGHPVGELQAAPHHQRVDLTLSLLRPGRDALVALPVEAAVGVGALRGDGAVATFPNSQDMGGEAGTLGHGLHGVAGLGHGVNLDKR